MKETVKCPKCDGLGYIGAFGHIADGICFCCNGHKTITVDREAQIAKLSDDTQKKAEWVLQSSEDSYTGLSYSKLLKIRNFCHSGWGIPEAYPNLQDHWFAVGKGAFQAAQSAKLATVGA